MLNTNDILCLTCDSPINRIDVNKIANRIFLFFVVAFLLLLCTRCTLVFWWLLFI